MDPTSPTGATRRRTTFVHLLLIGLLGGITACTPFDDAMVAIFGRSMRDQPSFDPYENPLPAPDDAVPFAAGNWPAGPDAMNIGQPEVASYMPPPMTQADLLQRNPVVMELENPIEETSESLARGEELYLRYCAVCHGETGIGSEAYIADVHPTVSAYDLAGETVAAYPDGYIYGMIRVGRGVMPTYQHAISHFDRWHIVNYVRQLQRDAGLTPGGGDGDGDTGAGAEE
ncbi:MAG: c-type cytochrome [Longimicrobiales bacterium]|nr:c-type cytochrome [Longimicrobiales bacterium]